MKRLALLFAVILLLPGCDATKKALSAFQKANPDKVAVGVDEDGDALTDVFVQYEDGKILVDAEGKPLEVTGTREALALAKADDSLISDEIAALAAVIGIPGLTYLGRLWARAKPLQRAQLWQTASEEYAALLEEAEPWKEHFKEVVRSIEEASIADPEFKESLKKNVGRISSATGAAIKDIKAGVRI